MPVTGWHLWNDTRPAHFLGVHAQQLMPLFALFAERALGGCAGLSLGAVSVLYVAAWMAQTWLGLSARARHHTERSAHTQGCLVRGP
jgi:hypothetical protein